MPLETNVTAYPKWRRRAASRPTSARPMPMIKSSSPAGAATAHGTPPSLANTASAMFHRPMELALVAQQLRGHHLRRDSEIRERSLGLVIRALGLEALRVRDEHNRDVRFTVASLAVPLTDRVAVRPRRRRQVTEIGVDGVALERVSHRHVDLEELAESRIAAHAVQQRISKPAGELPFRLRKHEEQRSVAQMELRVVVRTVRAQGLERVRARARRHRRVKAQCRRRQSPARDRGHPPSSRRIAIGTRLMTTSPPPFTPTVVPRRRTASPTSLNRSAIPWRLRFPLTVSSPVVTRSRPRAAEPLHPATRLAFTAS